MLALPRHPNEPSVPAAPIVFDPSRGQSWLSRFAHAQGSPVCAPRPVFVAIPARMEASSIAACLAALDRSAARVPGCDVRVLVLVNNSVDATAEQARNVEPVAIAIEVVVVSLPPADAHAGMARRMALDLCADRLPDDGVLMTTDADSCVDENWIAANLAELEAGADAVAGAIAAIEGDVTAMPEARHDEWHLAHLHARLHTLLDPRPHERWPTHIWSWGASLAVTVNAYRAVGGLPAIPLAEDRAFAEHLDRLGFRVRRSHAPVVYTSLRREGRAPGGFADLIDSYLHDQSALCDAALEPTAILARRLMWRARLRRVYADGTTAMSARTLQRLQLPAAPNAASFGQMWQDVEAISPRLQRERVRPCDLAAEIKRASRLIIAVQRAGGRDDTRPAGPAARSRPRAAAR